MSDNITPDPATPQQPPAGWYPDPQDRAARRYWDGAQWTEHAASPTPDTGYATASPVSTSDPVEPGVSSGSATAVATKRGLPRLKWWQWLLIAVGVLVLVSMIASAVNGALGSSNSVTRHAPISGDAAPSSEPSEEPVEMVEVPDLVGMTLAEARAALEAVGLTLESSEAGDDWIVSTQTPAPGQHPLDDLELSITSEEPKPVLTLGQENAIGSAQSYLSFSAFSRAGLYQQLTSEYGEGYEAGDAEFAIAYLEEKGLVDWNAEAVESAESYLEFSQFSRAGLYDQLTSEYGEGFTSEQTEYALSQVGY